jgi:HPr kinase/phosphorylase
MAAPLSPPTLVHASCVAIGGHGILLLGPSGAGKSDLALRLIDRGAVLVADDQCALRPEHGRLLCTAPDTLMGLLEVRGLGIIRRPSAGSALIALAVRLVERYERMPDPAVVEVIAGATIDAVRINPFEISAAIKVELALAAQLARG